jgi:hypothetical protein
VTPTTYEMSDAEVEATALDMASMEPSECPHLRQWYQADDANRPGLLKCATPGCSMGHPTNQGGLDGRFGHVTMIRAKSQRGLYYWREERCVDSTFALCSREKRSSEDIRNDLAWIGQQIREAG